MPETPAQEIDRLIAEGVWQPVEQDDEPLDELVERFNASALEFMRQVDEGDDA